MKLVTVEFLDPTTFNQWVTLDEMEQSRPRTCYARGRLLTENDDVVRVGLLDSSETVSDWIVIPAGCVLTVEEVN